MAGGADYDLIWHVPGMEMVEMETKCKISEFAGKPFIALYEIKDGKESERAVVQFGIKKAKAILASLEEIKRFVETKPSVKNVEGEE